MLSLCLAKRFDEAYAYHGALFKFKLMDIHCYGTLISNLTKAGLFDRANDAIKSLKRARLTWGMTIINILLDFYGTVQDWEHFDRLLVQLRTEGTLNRTTYGVMLKSYANGQIAPEERYLKLENTYSEMLAQGFASSLITLNTMVQGLTREVFILSERGTFHGHQL